MNKGEAIELMQEELGVRGKGTTYPESYLLKKLNAAQTAALLRISLRNPTLFAETGTGTYAANGEYVGLFTGEAHLRTLYVGVVQSTVGGNNRLRLLKPIASPVAAGASHGVSQPNVTHYSYEEPADGTSIYGAFLRFYPIPNVDVDFEYAYLPELVDLSSDSDKIFGGKYNYIHHYVVMKALRMAVGRGRNTADIQWILQAEKEAWDDIVMNIQPSGLEPMLGATGYTI